MLMVCMAYSLCRVFLLFVCFGGFLCKKSFRNITPGIDPNFPVGREDGLIHEKQT